MRMKMPRPIGEFIIDNCDGKQMDNGMWYHYSSVCTLLKLYVKHWQVTIGEPKRISLINQRIEELEKENKRLEGVIDELCLENQYTENKRLKDGIEEALGVHDRCLDYDIIGAGNVMADILEQALNPEDK